MEQIGWFVVGDGNFGPYLFGNQKSEPVGPVFIETEDDHRYWKNRGYDIILGKRCSDGRKRNIPSNW
jgi:hypothetical protein